MKCKQRDGDALPSAATIWLTKDVRRFYYKLYIREHILRRAWFYCSIYLIEFEIVVVKSKCKQGAFVQRIANPDVADCLPVGRKGLGPQNRRKFRLEVVPAVGLFDLSRTMRKQGSCQY